jgi:hypothetical protein
MCVSNIHVWNVLDRETDSPQVIIKWRGKPVFIRHRTETEIKEADDTKWEALRDPQPDSDRVQKPEWLIMLGTTPPILDEALSLLYTDHLRRLHPLGLCAYRRGRRFWRLVLPLPRFPLRHLGSHKKGTRPAQPRDPRVRLSRGRQGGYWLGGFFLYSSSRRGVAGLCE